MEDEPSTTFTNLSTLFSKLGITVEEEVDQGQGEVTWHEEDSERLQKALKTPPTTPPPKKSWRESPQSPPLKVSQRMRQSGIL